MQTIAFVAVVAKLINKCYFCYDSDLFQAFANIYWVICDKRGIREKDASLFAEIRFAKLVTDLVFC